MEIVGREHELGRVDAFIRRLLAGPAASLILEGEAGAGKTALWEAAYGAAGEAGARILAARPHELETGLAFAGIADLLAGAREPIDALPAPQAHALRIALLLEPADGTPADERAVGLGLLGVLQSFARDTPIVVAVDDLHWLDTPSLRALAFAARRLGDERVGLLLARRHEPASRRARVPESERTFPDMTRIDVGPLGIEDIHRLIRSRLGVVLSPPALRDVYATSGGNPFFALELARAIDQDGAEAGASGRLGVPSSLQQLVHARLGVLPRQTRRVLVAAAALADPTVELLSAAIQGEAGNALEAAVAADVVTLDDARVRFTHPLLAAAAYAGGGPSGRRDAHAALATIVREQEERARHLALAARGPDVAVALELDEAARSARARGAPVLAAELAELAAKLTPDDDEAAARRRHVDAALWLFEAGDSRRARAILERTAPEAAAGAERARVLVLLASVRSYDDDIAAARDLFRDAIAEAADDPELRLQAHEGVAATSFRLRDRLATSVDHAAEAAELARAAGRLDLLGQALATKAVCEAILGRTSATATVASALALEHASDATRITQRPSFAAAVVDLWHDDLDAAADRLRSLVDHAHAVGDESSVPYLHVMLGQVECVDGSFREAIRLTEGELEHARGAGQRTLVAYLAGVAAWARSYAGDEAPARALADQSLELAERTRGVPAWFFAMSALGQLELASGQAAAAIERLEPLIRFVREQGMCEPGATWCVGDAVEALVVVGRLDGATQLRHR
jgi:tetratricopeptide (TPR) repeat protein